MIVVLPIFEFNIRHQIMEVPVQDFKFRFFVLELGSDLLQLLAQQNLSGWVSPPHSEAKHVTVHSELVSLLCLR